MTKADKLLSRMRANPRDWRIEDLKAMAGRHGLTCDQMGTSHVTFRTPDGRKLSIPAAKPVKPTYVRLFVALLDAQEELP